MNRYQFVPAHNGIEIYFHEKPDESVRDEMKRNGWRWHSAKGCWYNKKSPSNEEFAKKLCTPLTKNAEKKVQPSQPSIATRQPSTVTRQPSCVTIQQYEGTALVGTLTVYKGEQGYSLASTNNQIICCDCRRFFSIHARACPFCGCPMKYVAEYYYKSYDPEFIRQQQIQQEKQRQEEQKRQERQRREDQKRQEEAEREKIIQELGLHSIEIRGRLYAKETRTLRTAKERANRLNKLNAPIRLSDETYVNLLCGGESEFEGALQLASQLKAMQSVLPLIKNDEWKHLSILSDVSLNNRIQYLIAEEKKRREKAEAYTKKRKEEQQTREDRQLKDLCMRYGIDTNRLASMIVHYGSKKEVLHKLQLADTIGGEYRQRINVISYMDSPDALKKLVSDLKRK